MVTQTTRIAAISVLLSERLMSIHSLPLILNFSNYKPFFMQQVIKLFLKLSLFVFVFTGLLGFYFLSDGQEDYALYCAKVGGFASAVFTAVVISEVMTIKGVRFTNRVLWIVAFLGFQIMAGLAYYLVDRKLLTRQPV